MSETDTLYVTDAELIRRLGVGEKLGRKAIGQLEHDLTLPPFPRKDPVFGDRRYFPAVKAFLDRRNGLSVTSGAVPAIQLVDGVENFDD